MPTIQQLVRKGRTPKGVKTKEDVIARVEAKANALIGNGFELSQPIELRFNELIGGVRGAVAVKNGSWTMIVSGRRQASSSRLRS